MNHHWSRLPRTFILISAVGGLQSPSVNYHTFFSPKTSMLGMNRLILYIPMIYCLISDYINYTKWMLKRGPKMHSSIAKMCTKSYGCNTLMSRGPSVHDILWCPVDDWNYEWVNNEQVGKWWVALVWWTTQCWKTIWFTTSLFNLYNLFTEHQTWGSNKQEASWEVKKNVFTKLKSILNMKRKCEGPNKLLLVKN